MINCTEGQSTCAFLPGFRGPRPWPPGNAASFLRLFIFKAEFAGKVDLMGGLKTYRILALALTFCAATPAAAGDPVQTLRAFADCAGRYTAETEHLWLFDGPASENIAARRDAFADLVGALAPDAGVDMAILRGWRVEARAAQGALLSAATFRRDAQAGVVARAYIHRCDRLLPTS
jgi:hypothetical protein